LIITSRLLQLTVMLALADPLSCGTCSLLNAAAAIFQKT
jgi:hypothetical protein